MLRGSTRAPTVAIDRSLSLMSCAEQYPDLDSPVGKQRTLGVRLFRVGVMKTLQTSNFLAFPKYFVRARFSFLPFSSAIM